MRARSDFLFRRPGRSALSSRRSRVTANRKARSERWPPATCLANAPDDESLQQCILNGLDTQPDQCPDGKIKTTTQ